MAEVGRGGHRIDAVAVGNLSGDAGEDTDDAVAGNRSNREDSLDTAEMARDVDDSLVAVFDPDCSFDPGGDGDCVTEIDGEMMEVKAKRIDRGGLRLIHCEVAVQFDREMTLYRLACVDRWMDLLVA